ncbi:hypothetical protein CABS01_13907 [Colletotrichum abscissum]|uniref:Uncharacterized protein n=1 Tax=Colletotrichum abscissum TaxID=1671311 RepID=A0A9Q0B323_9PEZI|nr:uncharacterized protein CABS01_13907 [Colletotrichum abscissum]KAI3547957.1 hypothetical protein CABS02_08425 [Colletotrichum abscissum]KAK1483755.1 hypothetical protein CABS01_13907 [Colletotrichum abscissum]
MEGRSGKVKESVGLDRACGHGPDDICTLSVPVTNRMSSAPSVDEAYAEGRIRRRRTADVLAVKLALWAVDPDGGYHSSQPADGCASPPDEGFHTPSRNGKEAGLPLRIPGTILAKSLSSYSTSAIHTQLSHHVSTNASWNHPNCGAFVTKI